MLVIEHQQFPDCPAAHGRANAVAGRNARITGAPASSFRCNHMPRFSRAFPAPTSRSRFPRTMCRPTRDMHRPALRDCDDRSGSLADGRRRVAQVKLLTQPRRPPNHPPAPHRARLPRVQARRNGACRAPRRECRRGRADCATAASLS